VQLYTVWPSKLSANDICYMINGNWTTGAKAYGLTPKRLVYVEYELGYRKF